MTNPDGTSAALAGGFTIEEPRTPQLWADIVGRPTIRLGLPATFYIVFGNRGNVDALAVPLVMDSWPPAIFSTFLGGGAPTIELTVHWRGRPQAAWHLARFTSSLLAGGYVEEDGELWGQDGRLVAQSRQLARFLPPG